MTARDMQIHRGRKFDQVLDGARQVFLSDGFEGASVDEIARVSRVSKATIYSYFADKRQMFTEVVRSECNRQAELALKLIDKDRPPQEVLTEAARQLLGIVLSDFSQRVFRICVAEADRFPELGRAFYESGPVLGRRRLCEYLRAAEARGELAIDDFDLAADQFAELCKATLWSRAVFGIQSEFDEAEIDRIAGEASKTFLARYGA
ncbi:TetR/AcrR family transcriptional regulator [Sediminimonas qiaohouensis]|uniref:TetR/AcrR family transcriptional regulator n=2 Tax=Roseobacteraceae TaxID=2854170 RepID=A0A7C9LNG6_9RHOB|nr:TetR/AcrR family transcriptional regulator [Sediminimonas qiaohouensis]MDR9485274.1 TetR/AcrR family transcriptional regulator [Sediminimonas sp.]MTJ04500.1 TetR/AcrR family transcriptional regulator [Sediminimonas qiaohouensis]